MAHLFDLPAEIILLFTSSLDHSDISRLVQTCRLAQRLLTPTLYTIGYRTALPWAAKNNHKQTVENSLTYGRPNRHMLFSALVAAAQHGHTKIVELLLDQDAPTELELELEGGQPPTGLLIFEARSPKDSPLVAAIVAGHLETVSLLLARGARTDVADRHNWFPLHHACDQRKVSSCVPVLLAAGADLHARSWDGKTAGEVAAGKGRDGSAPSSAILSDLLTGTNGQILADRTASGESIARLVISNGDGECCRLVLEFGMPLIPAVSPSELLMAAAVVGDQVIVSDLLQRGDLDLPATTDLEGNNAPMLAARYGHNAVLRMIPSHVVGDAHTWRNKDGQTILHLASSSGDVDTVRTAANLVKTTPKVLTMRDRRGRTPLLLATEWKSKNLAVIRLLVFHGANIQVMTFLVPLQYTTRPAMGISKRPDSFLTLWPAYHPAGMPQL